MDAALERFLHSLRAAGISRVPAPQAAPTTVTACADAQLVLAEVAAAVQACTRCALATARQHAVPGEGDPRARVVFVGEGPGADEDRSGRPFVGRAGKLLDDIIVKGMQLRREDTFICNVVKCRPPGNRVPLPDESEACADYLDRQLLAIRPAAICALGSTAAHRLLDSDLPLGRLRGTTHAWQGIPVICTYHPAYLLRNPAAKPECWRDIQALLQILGRA